MKSSARFEGRAVIPPSGVFGYVRDHGKEMISWQRVPVSAARRLDSFHEGYMVSGRSPTGTELPKSALASGPSSVGLRLYSWPAACLP
jgi:hypothetical protein